MALILVPPCGSAIRPQRARHHARRRTAPAALKQAEAFPPDVVALDIGLPGMDGYEIARRLRKLPGLANVLIVAVTGYGRPQDIRLSMEAGINHHLVKPLNPDVLVTLIE